MIFAAPWLLLALPALPLLWWLLRVTPPAPRTERFPAIRLLAGLRTREETPARTPWWLLALRIAAAALIVFGLARPVLDAGSALPGTGPVLLVLDDGWASAADWPARQAAAQALLDRVERAGRRVALLATAPDDAGNAPAVGPVVPVADLRPRVAAMQPLPWAVDRAQAARALGDFHPAGAAVAWVADGIATPGDGAFAAALGRIGPVTELAADLPAARLLLPPRLDADRLVLRVAELPRPLPSAAAVLAQTGDGRTLARSVIAVPAGAEMAETALALPPELRNQLTRLVLEGAPSAGGVVLLDERWRRRPVGMLAGNASIADVPLAGPLFYIRRALEPYAELREGELDSLLARPLAVLVLADRPLAEAEVAQLGKWVNDGGMLIRFAGPRTAERPDALLPVRLLEGARVLGGAMSWGQPAHLASFQAGTPFAGLDVPQEVTVSRQVLAEPTPDLPAHTWARLSDGTPLITEAARGAGRIVLVHSTANAEWSNLALSGLFVEMLRRMVQVSTGVAPVADSTPLRPAALLDGFGQEHRAGQAATALRADAIATTIASPRHPPGLYGPESGRRALNLSANAGTLAAAPAIAGGKLESLAGAARERALGPWVLALAALLFVLDLLVSLRLRGLLGERRSAIAAGILAAMLLAAAPARAQDVLPPDFPALATRLAYIRTGNAGIDEVTRQGLAGLSDYVNRRTAANLAAPAPVQPGTDDLSFYPLIYWPIDPDAAAPSAPAMAALNDFTSHGGIIVIDQRGSDAGGLGSGAGMAPGANAALRRITDGLNVPVLAPLTTDHVLARAFYLLSSFPGRYEGDTVWVQRDQDRTNDSVSPVIIGANDWAAAWAVDAAGRNPFATIPGGARQRTLAYRFGVNLVMYALTGNYKGDQVHVPAILQRLGQ